MPDNVKRHSYTIYTNKPYIYYHGVPCIVRPNNYIQPYRERTIVRSNDGSNIPVYSRR